MSMSSRVKVAKFGGTSMGSAEAMRKSADVVNRDPLVRVVVVSATSGTTNRLIELFQANAASEREAIHAGIADRHMTMAAELGANEVDRGELNAVLQEARVITSTLAHIQDKTSAAAIQFQDQLLSVGERLSSVLFSLALRDRGLNAENFDVRKILQTDDRFGKAEPNIPATRELSERSLRPKIAEGKIIVTQGFIGATRTGTTTTLGRGGSDYSAALLGEALDAQEVAIWTDVNGVMTMDPNRVKAARTIPCISFSEAAELANFGAKVLHPATLWPAIRNNIRVFVGNTFSPDAGGTWIEPEVDEKPLARAIAIRKNQTLITVSSLRMLNAHGFLSKLFGTLEQHRVSVDLVTTSEVSVALTIDGHVIPDELLVDLAKFSEVSVEKGLDLVALIGNRLTATPGIGALAFGTVTDVNIRLICQGASTHNLCFLVESSRSGEVAERLHASFLEQKNGVVA
jgi:aspartate kinase